MKTDHRIILEDAREMATVSDQSVDLLITSPPYPMIEMWDPFFSQVDPAVAQALADNDGQAAFENMHCYLDAIWKESYRTLKPGGIICLNIGDAVRTFKGIFQLYANHTRMIQTMRSLNLFQLPGIIWRKPTNAPNKFMGSGMLPPSAYVTLEHEHILIFRKAGKREFPDQAAKQARRENAYFWEERNTWFSDVWFDLIGASQALEENGPRKRSGAFPLELAYRLINMFSIRGDLVIDPFLGTGTTLIAAMCTGRNAVGYEIEPALHASNLGRIASVPALSQALARRRFDAHMDYVRNRMRSKGNLKYRNRAYGVPVVTRQEEDLILHHVQQVQFLAKDRFIAVHAPWEAKASAAPTPLQVQDEFSAPLLLSVKPQQLKLF